MWSDVWKSDGKCCVKQRSTQKVFEEHGIRKKSAKSQLRSTDRDSGALKGGGVRSAE